ncbi:helix-turn-helix transcriptional regulator [Yokenella regensburgei]|uniref:winged helix-turn-helix transcriptional regulator n=1 Tax=Yokenella regensburgei TaxID=158877 RepID=UPI003F184AB8
MSTPLSPSYQPCPVARAVEVMGDRWALLIIRDAFDGARRFGDFQRGLGMARNILTDRLRKLVDAEILETRPASDGSAYQEYVLTMKGKSLFPVIVALRQWGEGHLFTPDEPHSVLIDTHTGKPVAPMQPCAEDGRALTADHTRVQKLDALKPQ